MQEAECVQGVCRHCGHLTKRWTQPRILRVLGPGESLALLAERKVPVPAAYVRELRRQPGELVELSCRCEDCGAISTGTGIQAQWPAPRSPWRPLFLWLDFLILPLLLLPLAFAFLTWYLYLPALVVLLGAAFVWEHWALLRHGRYLLLRDPCARCGGTAPGELPDPAWRPCRCPACGELALRVDRVTGNAPGLRPPPTPPG